MAKRKKTQAQYDHAFELYTATNMTNADIAEAVGVAAQTVGKWINTDKWREIKLAHTVTPKREIQNMLIELSEINAVIQGRIPGKRIPTMQEVQLRKQITSTIKDLQKESTFPQMVEIFMDLSKHLKTQAPELAEAVWPHLNEILQKKAEEVNT